MKYTKMFLGIFLILMLTIVFLGCNLFGDDGSSVPKATLVVVNNSSYTIGYLYVSLVSSSEWGSDQLGSNVIYSGGTYTLNNITPGTYKLWADDLFLGTYWYRTNVELIGGDTWTWTLID